MDTLTPATGTELFLCSDIEITTFFNKIKNPPLKFQGRENTRGTTLIA
jgi:hypothetical protein